MRQAPVTCGRILGDTELTGLTVSILFILGGVELFLMIVDAGGATKQHIDRNDSSFVSCLISCTGAASMLVLSSIKTKIYMEPGDLLLLRGDIIPHYTENWCGKRFSYVYFTDRNLFTEHVSACA